MATRYAVANGNWSSTATWDGGTLPTAADDVHANNRTVTIDQNVTVLSLRTTAGGAAVAGGSFTIPNGSSFDVTATAATGFIAGSSTVLNIVGTGTRTIAGNATGSATTANISTIYVTHSSGNIPTVTINGNLLGGSQSGSVALYIWGGYVTVNGSVTGGTASTSAGGINIFNSDNQPTQLTVNTGPVTGGSSSSGSTGAIGVSYSPNGSALTNSFVAINCNVIGGSAAASNYGIVHSSNIPITITGNCQAPSIGHAFQYNTTVSSCTINGNCLGGPGGYGVWNNTTGTITINGNCTGGSATNTPGIYNNSSGTFITNGTITAGSGSNAHGLQLGGGKVVHTGNVVGGPGPGSGSIGIWCNSTAAPIAAIVYGNVTGGAGQNCLGVANINTGVFMVYGTATGGAGSGAVGARNDSSGTLFVTKAAGNGFGPGSTGVQYNAGVMSLSQGSVTQVEEMEFGARGAVPIAGPGQIVLVNQTTNKVNFLTSTGTRKTLVDGNASGLMPAVTDVRSGVSYNAGNLTGTCAVPAASSVAAGVAVDNTVGTAALTQASVWDYSLSSASSVAGSVGEKLKKTAIPADIIALS